MHHTPVVERHRGPKSPGPTRFKKPLEQADAKGQQLVEQSPFDLMSRRAVLGRLLDPLLQRVQLLMHIGQLPFDVSIVVAIFRILCHHDSASMLGKRWLLTPTLSHRRHFLSFPIYLRRCMLTTRSCGMPVTPKSEEVR